MYLVDGNNVMDQRVGWHRDKPGAQRRLLRELAEFARTRGAEVTVVFDGRPLPDISDGESIDGVSVFFARPGSDADHRILELGQDAPYDQRLIAVTSDRMLAESLRDVGITTIRSGQFRRMLEEES